MPAARYLRVVSVLFVAWMTPGCINTDPAVFVEASLRDPAVNITSSVLASGLDGEVTLDLHLGPRASGASSVSVVSSRLLSADGSQEYTGPLAMSSSPTMPVSVGLDEDVTVRFVLQASENLADDTMVANLCQSGPVVFSVGLDDSLRDGGISADSSPFSPSGCP